MKRLFAILLSLVLFCNVDAQERRYSKQFAHAFPNSKETFRGQTIKKKRDGMGVLAEKSGAVYAGDFKNGKMHGLGMYIASSGRYVDGCDSCVVYVGDFVDGKKQGMGTCYDEFGRAFYRGRFDKGKPKGTYPDAASAGGRSFLVVQEPESGGYIFCESRENKLNGLALTILGDGRIILQSYKNSLVNGIGLLAVADGNWFLFNEKKGEPIVVSSSYEYAKVEAARKQLMRELRNDFFAATTEFATKINAEAEYLQNIRGGGSTGGSSEVTTDAGEEGTSRSKGGGSPSSCKKCKGSGKCMSHGRNNSCFGTGVCQFCIGTGWISAGGDRTACANCKNGDGKCKWCKGTGKCEACGGKH